MITLEVFETNSKSNSMIELTFRDDEFSKMFQLIMELKKRMYSPEFGIYFL
jgi:hypothetical protein